MARNTTLGQVRYAVKAETGKSLAPTATNQDAEINAIINDIQAWLAATYDWPFLKSRWESILTPATRYQVFPTTNNVGLVTALNLERPMSCLVIWNQIWQEVIYGIDEIPEFNYLSSDRNQVLDPIQRWQFDDELKFEVWPLPATGADIRWVGQRTLTTLLTSAIPVVWNDSATLDLDDLLVTYFASAEYLTREESPRAKLQLEKAQRRLVAIRGGYPVRSQTICIGRGQPLDRKTIRQIPMVLVAGNTH